MEKKYSKTIVSQEPTIGRITLTWYRRDNGEITIDTAFKGTQEWDDCGVANDLRPADWNKLNRLSIPANEIA